ncbi:MAG: hypothetical protein ACKVJX_06800 [Verrucomicrobiia bacterium]
MTRGYPSDSPAGHERSGEQAKKRQVIQNRQALDELSKAVGLGWYEVAPLALQ